MTGSALTRWTLFLILKHLGYYVVIIGGGGRGGNRGAMALERRVDYSSNSVGGKAPRRDTQNDSNNPC